MYMQYPQPIFIIHSGILNESKLLPSLPTTAQKKVPQKRILRKKVPHHEVVIKKSDFDQYLQGPWHEVI